VNFDTEEAKKVPAGSAGMDRQKYGPASCDIVGRARLPPDTDSDLTRAFGRKLAAKVAGA